MEIVIDRPKNFDIFQIFDCGQCFRFDKFDDNSIIGVAFSRVLKLRQDENSLFLTVENESDEALWRSFLALDMDYALCQSDMTANFKDDTTLFEAIKNGNGIRILRQDFWETLCSFIISQNNNIPRIKKIIATLSEKFGEKFEYDGNIYYAFPTAEKISSLSIDELYECKMGFRAKYVKDAADKVASGEIDEEFLRKSDTATVISTLCKIYGVGAKVASCVALFSLEKYDAFPVDVWIKRILNKYYSEDMDISLFGKYAGIAQQYLFYYERYQN